MARLAATAVSCVWYVSVFVSHSVCSCHECMACECICQPQGVCVCVCVCVRVLLSIVAMDGTEHDNSFEQAEAEVLATDFD